MRTNSDTLELRGARRIICLLRTAISRYLDTAFMLCVDNSIIFRLYTALIFRLDTALFSPG